jgi:hypothetical protein
MEGIMMQMDFQVSGNERKRLVEEIAFKMGMRFRYLGTPSFDYQIGDSIFVNKSGIVTYGESDKVLFESIVVKFLHEVGFIIETPIQSFEEDEITLFGEYLNDGQLKNLTNLIHSKKRLIEKAIGADNLSFHQNMDKLTFPWFSDEQLKDDYEGYVHFIKGLVNRAKSSKRIRSIENEITNEKYSFRIFLNCLGLIGEEYKSTRKLLLKNLTGNSAFKNGRKNNVSKQRNGSLYS